MGRLEFRVFGADLAKQSAALSEMSADAERETREDLYFVGNDITRPYKLRGGKALDLKHLSETTGGYQRWDVSGPCDLPADSARVAACLDDPDDLPCFGPTQPLDPGDVAAVFEGSGHIAVRARKSRTQWDLGSCLAEMTRVSLWGQPDDWTVAIEGSNVSELDQLKDTLCLRNFANQSYPEWLAGMLFPGPEQGGRSHSGRAEPNPLRSGYRGRLRRQSRRPKQEENNVPLLR